MFEFRIGPRRRQVPSDLRTQMIRETSAFLTWALAKDRGLPRVPRRRVDEGGFGPLLQIAGARALVDRWWARVLSTAEYFSS